MPSSTTPSSEGENSTTISASSAGPRVSGKSMTVIVPPLIETVLTPEMSRRAVPRFRTRNRAVSTPKRGFRV